MNTNSKNTYFYRLESIEYKTQKYKNIPKKNKDETLNVDIKYLGIYSELFIAQKAMKEYINFNEQICFAGFRITKEYVNDKNHLYFYEPDMTYIYDKNDKHVAELEGRGKDTNFDNDVYIGFDNKRISLKRGDFVMCQYGNDMIPGILIEYPISKKGWKERKLSPSNNYDATYIIATTNGYDHPKITHVYPAPTKPTKKLLKKMQRNFIRFYCSDLNHFNKQYKKYFDKFQ